MSIENQEKKRSKLHSNSPTIYATRAAILVHYLLEEPSERLSYDIEGMLSFNIGTGV